MTDNTTERPEGTQGHISSSGIPAIATSTLRWRGGVLEQKFVFVSRHGYGEEWQTVPSVDEDAKP